jgi:hypothetical protein
MTMTPFRRLVPFLLLVLAAWPARAEVVYPTGSRLGLEPPPGMAVSKGFFGFEDRPNNVGIVMVTFPAEAYAELEKTITGDTLRKQGVTVEAREPVTLPSGKGFLVIGSQQVEKTKVRKLMLVAGFPALTALVTVQIPDEAKSLYPDATMRAALLTVTARDSVPVNEQLALLPFTVSDLASFNVVGVIPGRAIMLSDAQPATPAASIEPHMLIAIGASDAIATADRDQFARDLFLNIPDFKGARITASESLRFGGQQGHQIFASAQDPNTGTEISVVQWLRFGGSGFMQLLGVARADAWRDAYQRFRTVRDGLEPR